MTLARSPEAAVPVAIVGAGPVGLALALGLARHGVRSTVLERKPGTSERSKAPGIHVRTREALRRWGVEEPFLAAGTLRRTLALHDVRPGRPPLLSLDFGALDAEADRPGVLFLEQGETEALLLASVRETGLCDVRFRVEAVDVAAGRDGVRITYRDGAAERSLDAEIAVGCDGARSTVRRSLGLGFPGRTYALRPLLADVRVDDERDGLPWPRVHAGGDGYLFALRIRPGLWRVVHLDAGGAGRDGDVSRAELEPRVSELLGPGPFDVVWASRFRIHRRAAPRFRAGRVLLAGDAAHVHSPAGGLGMNAGIQDAQNLAWKLARALGGGDADRLLDSYEVERRAVVVEDVSAYTDLVTRLFLQTPAPVRTGMFALSRALARAGSVRRRLLRRTAMLDLDYPSSPLLSGDAPSAGVRLPNPPLRVPGGGCVRLYDVLPQGPAALAVGREPLPGPPPPLPDPVRIGPDGHLDATGLLGGLVPGGEGWLLVRPDAHVAWARPFGEDLRGEARAALGAPAG